ncbi:magnesium-translocating P-type ATPase [Brucepastera parasyntrophica]|uniref:magnesium-translocating P-type ATPase n=1 Tax=Brucepastera parasyntrophica TaxID=2880008 RepID=UPI002109D6DA|nr:magnesium-translocating P-type ATPase [Brucepastera parasyntrophica]ULQ58579.1 magnesium-translocating P-type ATPase [Brucepastera parasyntrophica]
MKKEIKKNNSGKAAAKKVLRDRIIQRLIFTATNEPEDIFSLLSTAAGGLNEKDVSDQRDKFGTNRVTHQKKKTLLQRIISAFVNPFTCILFCLVLVSVITDIVLPLNHGKETEPITIFIILIMILFSGILRFVQETRSDNAADKLLDMITTTVAVERVESGEQEIPLGDVVVGDIVRLAAGDMVPADVRILEAKDLFISQAALTGESDPLEKDPLMSKDGTLSITDYTNLAFMGSNVVSGSAKAVVVATGDDTLFGTIAESIAQEPVVTSFEKGVNSVSWVLIRFMLIMVPVVFFINGITKGDWISALLFAISIAVGLTPEMLPMIVTTCLAKGAVSMSKEKTIIKKLNSIQDFGAMDILCTDKTGTITQDKVVLEYHMDVYGKEDSSVLLHAFLNSYYQTGLKNLLDIAVIRRTQEESEKDESLKNLSSQYHKVDEIPFDFSRRRMSVVVADKAGTTQMITKGAVEEMLSICSFVQYDGSVKPLTDEIRETVLKTVDDYNDDGLRVIAVAQKTDLLPAGVLSVGDEKDMTLIGYLAFLDPPKESTALAIKTLAEYGVTTKILTGDNDKVTRSICKQVGMRVDNLLLGSDIEKMSDDELGNAADKTNVFAKLSPDQKARIVHVLRDKGHIVGFMGDGINDAAAMKASDVGISVDTAVDIAKESADVILLEKDLMVLEKGIVEGRKTYANMIKYIKMTASSNFGNMFSVLAASAFLPFLPMLSVHLIILNLIYDFSCTAIPWDNVDVEFLRVPRKWDASSVGSFMLWIGPVSSIFDITTYLVMYFIICPHFVSGGTLYNAIPASDTVTRGMYEGMFQAGWFIESMWTQTLVIHMIRTPKIPFIQSHASFPVTTLTCCGIALLSVIPFTGLGKVLDFVPPPAVYWPFLVCTILLYMVLITFVKKLYIRRHNGELL